MSKNTVYALKELHASAFDSLNQLVNDVALNYDVGNKDTIVRQSTQDFVAMDKLKRVINKVEAKKLNILMLEDNKLCTVVLRRLLEAHCPCDITACEEVKSAIAELDKPYDLIFSDLHLPDGHGCDFIKACKASKANAKTPVVVATSEETEEALEPVVCLDVLDIIVKPVMQPDIVAVMTRYSEAC